MTDPNNNRNNKDVQRALIRFSKGDIVSPRDGTMVTARVIEDELAKDGKIKVKCLNSGKEVMYAYNELRPVRLMDGDSVTIVKEGKQKGKLATVGKMAWKSDMAKVKMEGSGEVKAFLHSELEFYGRPDAGAGAGGVGVGGGGVKRKRAHR
jgi:hypothetical protein